MVTEETLLRIVDQALEATAARSGAWLVCQPGCSQCCHGAFAINALDANRLRAGLQELRQTDPARAMRIDDRARQYVNETAQYFPGDAGTGLLGEDEASQRAFEDFENERACPVLDPVSQTCDLYGARPMTCRVFGPPVRNSEGLGVCELCYGGATPAEIESCEMVPDAENLEAALLADLERTADGQAADGERKQSGSTLVAYALRPRSTQGGV